MIKYFNNINIYFKNYIKNSLENIFKTFLLIKSSIINLINFFRCGIHNLCNKKIFNTTLIFIIQLLIFYYIWVSCTDIIHVFTFTYWTQFFYLPDDFLIICSRIIGFLFIYYIIMDLIDVQYFNSTQTYVFSLLTCNIFFIKYFYYFIYLFYYLSRNVWFSTRVKLPIKWTPIFKRHSYFGLWRNYRNNFFN